jgi:hypothetical protein
MAGGVSDDGSQHNCGSRAVDNENPSGPKTGSGCRDGSASLKAQLGITEDQSRAWAEFAATLSANRRRMQRTDDEDPFGLVEDRLVALGSMRRAAGELFSVLRADQECKALQLLPLCCLPQFA